MRRLNVRDAFMGEPSGLPDPGGDDEGDEALVLAVRGGEVVLVIPAGTAEDDAVERAAIVRGTLRLENERVLTFEIQDGAVGAFYEQESADLFRRRQETGSAGLSSIGSAGSLASSPRLARDVMTSSVITVSPDVSLPEVTRLLTYHNVSGFPVCDDDKLVGVVSEADVISKVGSHVREIMTEEVISVTEDTTLDQIAKLMAARRIKRVPVVRAERLVGIISRADLVRAMADQR